MAFFPMNENLREACEEIIDKIIDGKITKNNLEYEKINIARKYNIGRVIKNAEIFHFAKKDNNYQFLKEFLKIKPIRTLSGVANISVMWLDKTRKSPHDKDQFFSCPGDCIYCVQGSVQDEKILLAPKSYSGCEPTTMRAIRNNFDPYLQTTNRIKQLHVIGHSTDKCELIVMGGTFTAMPNNFQNDFIKGCLDAMNEKTSETLDEAQSKNEIAPNRCVGLTIETRADFCNQKHIDEMLRLGCTRVEIGIQSTDDKILSLIRRGHDARANMEAIERIKRAGLKFTAHWMPGLTGLMGEVDERKEIEMFHEMFENPAYQPDELKIYPVLVLSGTELYKLWQNGKYKPLTKEQMLRLLIEMKKIVPNYVRIKRVMRDISEHEAKAGASTTNLRQLAKIRMEE
ncbi:MAG: tRNA uridine(34) 5-carboxymethylaminomethyl modification radical SAM/GNAT enzyme Elp3, partial [Candidatus Aenigmarchaeota archaeon]|nr:tRNA uridine(34) 5-carboxymethylaminomethyl modification radical SAM/GNAT enzyme Elp3 [Candidatus Aenigmarchaeota archaeon]